MYKILIIVVHSILAGMAIAVVCMRLWLYLAYEPEYTEPDDTPDEDWVQECYRSAEDWKDEH